MTIEQLLHCSASELEQMSDAQLLDYFKDCLEFTRHDSPKAMQVGGRSVLKLTGATSVKIGGQVKQLSADKALKLAEALKASGLTAKSIGLTKR